MRKSIVGITAALYTHAHERLRVRLGKLLQKMAKDPIANLREYLMEKAAKY